VPASNPSSDLEYEHGIEKADVLKSYYLTIIKSTKRNKNGVKNRTGQNNQVTVKLFVFDKLQKNRTPQKGAYIFSLLNYLGSKKIVSDTLADQEV
jgi:hypothetical protein